MMKRPKNKSQAQKLERLKHKMQFPPFGLGAMHYSSKARDELQAVFNTLPMRFIKCHTIAFPRNAQEYVSAGKKNKIINVGVYYVINRIRDI